VYYIAKFALSNDWMSDWSIRTERMASPAALAAYRPMQ
jgi:hypothetical protein